MDAVRPQKGDVVMVNRVRTFFALVERVDGRRLAIRPLDPRIDDTLVRPHEIVQVYRAVGRPARPPKRLRPSPRQLRLDDG